MRYIIKIERYNMEKIELVLRDVDFPLVLSRYGAEGAKNYAIETLLNMGEEITVGKLNAVLCNLETDLQMQTASMSDEDE